MMQSSSNANTAFRFISAAMTGMFVSGFFFWLLFARDTVTRGQMETYIEKHSPYQEDRNFIGDKLKELEKSDDFIKQKLQTIENQHNDMEKQLNDIQFLIREHRIHSEPPKNPQQR